MLALNRRILVRGLMVAALLFGFGLRLQVPAQAAPIPYLVDFALPAGASGPDGITEGPDGALWFALEFSSQIGRRAPDGTVTLYNLPTGTAPIDIAKGPDGAMWFSEYGPRGRVGRITTDGKTITHFPVKTANARIWGIAAGSDGAMWFTEFDKQKIGRIVPGTGAVTEFNTPSGNAYPSEITLGPDGNMFFAEEGGARIGKVTIAGGVTPVVTESTVMANPVPGATVGPGPCGIVAGSDGKVWFGLEEGDAVGSITTDLSSIEVHRTPTAHSSPIEMTLGPDGNVWVTESESNKIARVTPAFVFTEYSVPTSGAWPYGITFASDGSMWFTENARAKIGTMRTFTPSVFYYMPLVRH